MAEKIDIELQLVVTFSGYNVSKTGLVKINVDADENQAVNVINLLKFCDVNADAEVKIAGREMESLGKIDLDKFTVSNTGSSKITFSSITQDCELDVITDMAYLEPDTHIILKLSGEYTPPDIIIDDENDDWDE